MRCALQVDKDENFVTNWRGMSETALALLAIAMVLTLVSVLVPVAERLRVPHTVLLALCGMALGFVGSWVIGRAEGFGVVRDAFVGLHNFEVGPEVLLSLFLPPLLFTAGLTIDVRRLIDEFAAVLLLAIVAVLVCVGIVGGVVHLATGFDLMVCLLLGAVVSTTDPAAVIGIFRDVGAPKRLSILAEGESLFNDAAAITTFGILMTILVHKVMPDAAQPGIAFVREFVGGIVVGCALARITVFILPRIGDSDAAIASITVSLAYFSYIVSAYYLHVSGIVAVVVAALTLAAYGPTHLHPRAWSALKQTWHQLEFWANCLIFVFASMLAANVLSNMSAFYAWTLLAVIVSAFSARALVVYGMLPILVSTRLVQPIGGPYKAILVWGGLRGAVTIVLALVAAGDTRLPTETREFVAVLATLFVLFTLFVNAPSLRLLMRILDLNKLSRTEVAVRDRVIELSRANAARQMRLAARQDGGEPEAIDRSHEASVIPPDWSLNLDERVTVGLLTLCTREKDLYLEHFEQQTLSRRMVAILTTRADALIDSVKTNGAAGYELALRQVTTPSLSFRLALWLHRRFGWEAPLTSQLADRFEVLIVSQGVLDELTEFNREAVGDLLGYDAGERLETMLAERCGLVDRALKALSLQYSGYTEAVQARHRERAAIRFEAAEYSRRLRESTINREVYDDLRKGLAVRREALRQRPPLRLGLELAAMIGRVPLFGGLDARGIVKVGSLLRAHLAIPGEKVIAAGRPADAMYFIAAGSVTVHVRTGPVELREGNFFGEMGLLTSQPRNADVVADGYCHLLALAKRDFNRLLAARPELRAEIEAVAARRLASAAAESVTA
jgi:CPA1 family monovalent cation:H+ antiporter